MIKNNKPAAKSAGVTVKTEIDQTYLESANKKKERDQKQVVFSGQAKKLDYANPVELW